MKAPKIGDLIKSLDFNGVDNCYMIGQVQAIGSDGLIKAKLLVRIWEGKEQAFPQDEIFQAPKQGLAMFDNPAMPRIQVI